MPRDGNKIFLVWISAKKHELDVISSASIAADNKFVVALFRDTFKYENPLLEM